MAIQKHNPTSLGTTNVADLLERVLDKGVVIAGDVKVKLLDIELLTIQIRLVVCSVDKAKEIGLDWWANTSAFCSAEAKPVIQAGSDSSERVSGMMSNGAASHVEGRRVSGTTDPQARIRMLEAELQQLREGAYLPARRPEGGMLDDSTSRSAGESSESSVGNPANAGQAEGGAKPI